MSPYRWIFTLQASFSRHWVPLVKLNVPIYLLSGPILEVFVVFCLCFFKWTLYNSVWLAGLEPLRVHCSFYLIRQQDCLTFPVRFPSKRLLSRDPFPSPSKHASKCNLKSSHKALPSDVVGLIVLFGFLQEASEFLCPHISSSVCAKRGRWILTMSGVLSPLVDPWHCEDEVVVAWQ